MNINDLTIGQAKELAAMFGGKAGPQQALCDLIGKKVIVRAYRAGVHYGTLKSISGEVVTLTNARRLYYWKVEGLKGISLSDVAEHGLHDDSKVCAAVAEQIVIDACEVMTVSAEAQKSIEAKNAYRP